MDPISFRLMQGASGGTGAVEFVASAQAQNSGSSTLVISKPAGTQNGDLMIALCTSAAARSWTDATGWTEVIDQNASPSIRVAYKVDGGSEPASYTFTLSASNNASGVIATFRRAAYDTIGTISTAQSSGTQTAPAITLSFSSSAILAFFAHDTASKTWSSPTAGLISTATDSDATQPSFALYRQLDMAAGSTGTRSATVNASANNFGCILVGIKPA